MNSYLLRNWNHVISVLSTEPPGSRIRLAKHLLPHPKDVGMRIGIGLPLGQQFDYRLKLADCRGLHVQDFGTHYEVHIDQVDPTCDAVQHLVMDAPGTFVATAAVIGGLFGLAFSRSGNGFVAGALVGAGIGGITAAASRSTSRQSSAGQPISGVPNAVPSWR